MAWLIYLPSNKNLEFLEQIVLMQLNNQKWSGSLEEVRLVSHAELLWTSDTQCVWEPASGPSQCCTLQGLISETQFQLYEAGTLLCPGSATWHRARFIAGAQFLLGAGLYNFGMLTKYGYFIVSYSDCVKNNIYMEKIQRKHTKFSQVLVISDIFPISLFHFYDVVTFWW